MKTKITKRVVDAVEPGEKQIYVYDTELPGFGFRVMPSGVKSFFVQYGPTRRRVTIGHYGILTVDQARREAARLLAEVALGDDPAEVRAEKRKGFTVADLAARYLEDHATIKKKPRSIKEDMRLLEKIILPALGKRKVKDITRTDVARFHHSLRETPTQANRALALLSKMFNLAEKWGFRPDNSNPCRHVEKYKEKPRERFLTDDELARLGRVLSECDEHPSAITCIRLLLFTGCRRGEILGLRWENVFLEEGFFVLEDSKTGKRMVPINQPTREVLETAVRRDDNPFVCWGEKPGQALVGITKIWDRIRKRAGIEDVRLHDLRHSYASEAAGAGLGLNLIGALLGHTQAQTTKRYAHLALEPLKGATDLVGNKIAEAMKGTPKVVPLRRE
jgi:integrase